MIYLIGGPPKCGKTTLAKKLSKTKNIPWVSTDSLQCAVRPYLSEEDFPKFFPATVQRCDTNDEKYFKYSVTEIIKAYCQQAKTIYQAVDMFIACEIADGNDFIIEGYHIEPSLIAKLNKKYPSKLKSVFLIKSDENKFVDNINKSATPNDWIIAKTNNRSTYNKIAKMVCKYGKIIKKDTKKYDLKILNVDNNFDKQINKLIDELISDN